MSKYNLEKTLKPLLFISKAIGLFVSNNNKLSTLYVLMIIIILIALFFWSLCERLINRYPKHILTSFDVLGMLCIAVTSIISIVIAAFTRRERIQNLFKNIGKIDKNFSAARETYYLKKYRKRIFLSETIIFHVIIFAYYSSYYFTYQKYILVIRFETGKLVYLYVIFIVVLQIYNVCLNIKYQFQALNSKLAETPHYLFNSNDICALSKMHDKLCDLMETVSDNYGVQIFLICILIMLFIIRFINFSFRIVFENVRKRDILIQKLFHTIIFLLFGILITTSCDQLSQEAQRTGILLYKLQFSQKPGDLKFLLFAKRVKDRDPHVSAAGYFRVNSQALLSILGGIASFTLIIVQLK